MRISFTRVFFAICIFLIGAFAVYNSRSYEGYELNKREEEILVYGIKLENDKYEFKTAVNLGIGDEEDNLNSIIELTLITEMNFDSISNKYILENTELNIRPILGEVLSIDPKNINGNIFVQNIEFGIEKNQGFNQVMEVGYAKLLVENKNVVINQIVYDNNSNMNYKKELKRLKDNSELISVNYNNLENYYNCWYRIEFEINSDGQGVFTIF